MSGAGKSNPFEIDLDKNPANYAPLTPLGFIERAAYVYPERTAVIHGKRRFTWSETYTRCRRLGSALARRGIGAGETVAVMLANTPEMYECNFGVPMSGAVLNALNTRLDADAIAFMLDHGGARVLITDREFSSTVERALALAKVKPFLVDVDDGEYSGPGKRIGSIDYEAFIADADPRFAWQPPGDEWNAISLNYTSGTTGNPKGVVYSHRSTVLHSMISLIADGAALSERDVVLPIVPMFHANAWGLPYGCLLAGSTIVFPGPNMAPQAILELLAKHKVTVTGGVPTIWMGALPMLDDYDLSHLRVLLCGGSAVPKSLSEAYREKLGIPLLHAWGMTETSPIATMSTRRSQHDELTEDERANVRAKQGQPVPLVELRLVDPDSGAELPWDDVQSGEIQAAGPWIAKEYYRGEGGGSQYTDDGWLRTGDVAAGDRYGFVRLVDRTKDLVKSGGEWISSVELENEIMAHPKIAEAAVIAIPHERWVERPMACVVLKPGESLTAEEVLEHLKPRVAKWWLPDAVEFIDEVPKTSVGKFSKKTLRDKFAGYKLPGSDG